MARPSKFDEVQNYILEMAKLGLTDKQMADVVGVTEHTINNWKAKNPQFFQSLKENKALADENVERSLFERATGYECLEDKIFNNNGEPMTVPTVKQYPPDTTAAIFWLKNRQPGKWRDKQEIEHSGSQQLNLAPISSEELKKMLNE